MRSSLPFGQWDDLPESSAQNPKIQSPSVGFKSDFAETLTTQVLKSPSLKDVFSVTELPERTRASFNFFHGLVYFLG